MDNFLIRVAHESDTNNVLALMRVCFGERDFFNLSWYNWFNFTCPTGDNRLYVMIDMTSGRFVSGYGLLPIKVRYNSEIYNASLCTNVMVHPDYQGKGLFVKMGLHCLANEKNYNSLLSLGVPNKNALPGHLKVGWQILSPLIFISKKDFRRAQTETKKVDKFDKRINNCIYLLTNKVNFMVLKDHNFLNWRYVDRPDKRYSIYVLEERQEIFGYVVLKYFNDNGYKKAHILDICATNYDSFSELILTAELFASELQCDELNCWQIQNSIYKDWFFKNGFSETSQGNVLIIYSNMDERKDPDPENWWFCLGDNDVF